MNARPEHLAFAQANGIEFQSSGGPNGIIYQIDRARFRSGLKHAIEMGTFFFTLGKQTDSTHWKFTQLEVEFDTSIGGDFKLVTVNSSAQVVLDFNRTEQ